LNIIGPPSTFHGERDILVSSGSLDYSRWMASGYTVDGLLAELRDEGGQRAIYTYDADGNRTTAAEAQGLTSSAQTPLAISATFDDFDQLTRVCAPKTGGGVYAEDVPLAVESRRRSDDVQAASIIAASSPA